MSPIWKPKRWFWWWSQETTQAYWAEIAKIYLLELGSDSCNMFRQNARSQHSTHPFIRHFSQDLEISNHSWLHIKVKPDYDATHHFKNQGQFHKPSKML